jgi:hypothetical protein
MLVLCNSKMCNTVTETVCWCRSLQRPRGGLIMTEDNSDGEQTLKKGKDTYERCR